MIKDIIRICSPSELGTPEDLGALEVFLSIHKGQVSSEDMSI